MRPTTKGRMAARPSRSTRSAASRLEPVRSDPQFSSPTEGAAGSVPMLRAVRFPLVRKIALLIAAVAAGGTFIGGGSNYYRRIQLENERAAGRLLAVASTGALFIDGDRHEHARIGSADYRAIRSQLRAIRDANGLRYDGVYTLRVDEKAHFWFGVTPHEDASSFSGAPYPDNTPPQTLALMRQVLADGRPVATPPWQDAKGTWISAFAPILDGRGQVVALLEADVAVKELRGAALQAARTVAGDSAMAALFAALVGLLFAVRIVRPIRLITRRMELIAAGKADLTQELASTGRDEVRGLMEGFNRSVRSLREIVRGVHRIGARASQSASAGEEVARSLLEGSRGQVKAIEQTRVAAQALGAATSQISRATEQLDASAHEVTAAVVTMERSATGAGQALSRMNESIASTASNIGQLTSAIQTINRNVGSLSETAEVVTASVTQLDASLREINRFTEETAVFSVTTREAAEAGREAVSATATGMLAIAEHTRKVNDTMVGLASCSEEIGDIVEVIRSVAERTNLLALNAAIIAARAGEQGQGFQVVAQEIRDLAERTRTSTADIAGLIARVQRESAEAVQLVAAQAKSVADGRELAQEALGELERIADVADETSHRISGIVARAGEQTQASRSVLGGVERIHEMLQLITRATREQSQSSAAVQHAAVRMQEDAARTTSGFADQAAQIRGIVQTMERMVERIGSIHLQTRAQSGDAARLGRGISEVLALAEGFFEEAHKLDGAMAAIATEVATLLAEVQRFKVA